jgi:hypothetical protein
MELARRRKHGAEAAGLDAHPDEQRCGHHKHEGRAEGLQAANGFDAAPDHNHVEQPEAEEAGPKNPLLFAKEGQITASMAWIAVPPIHD